MLLIEGDGRRYSRNLKPIFDAFTTLQVESPLAELVKTVAPSDDAASLRLRIKEEVRVNVEKRKSQQSMGGGKNGIQLQGEFSDTLCRVLIIHGVHLLVDWVGLTRMMGYALFQSMSASAFTTSMILYRVTHLLAERVMLTSAPSQDNIGMGQN